MPKLRRVNLDHRHSSAWDKLPPTGLPRGLAGSRRNAGRNDGFTWNSDNFISAPQVDGYPSESDESEGGGDMTFILQMIDALEAKENIERRSLNISLLEMARPARARGGAKKLETVKKHVVAVRDDDEDNDFEMVDIVEEDWESVYAEDTEPVQRQTYSEVLRGNGEW